MTDSQPTQLRTSRHLGINRLESVAGVWFPAKGSARARRVLARFALAPHIDLDEKRTPGRRSSRLPLPREGNSVSVSLKPQDRALTTLRRGHKTDTSGRTHSVTAGTEPVDESGCFVRQTCASRASCDPPFPCSRSIVRKGSSVRVRLRASLPSAVSGPKVAEGSRHCSGSPTASAVKRGGERQDAGEAVGGRAGALSRSAPPARR